MSNRRVWIVLLFLLVGALAVSRIVFQERDLRDELHGERSGDYRRDIGKEAMLPVGDSLRQKCGILLDRLLLMSVTIHFLMTALLLLKTTIQGK